MDKEIRKRYSKLVATIEDAKIYDGRGTYDLYKCAECGHQFFTTYKDKGVTPFTIPCEKCGCVMMHIDTYHEKPENCEVRNFVRPTLKQLLKMPEAMIEHVLKGGLVFEEELPRSEMHTAEMYMADISHVHQSYHMEFRLNGKGFDVWGCSPEDVKDRFLYQLRNSDCMEDGVIYRFAFRYADKVVNGKASKKDKTDEQKDNV